MLTFLLAVLADLGGLGRTFLLAMSLLATVPAGTSERAWIGTAGFVVSRIS